MPARSRRLAALVAAVSLFPVATDGAVKPAPRAAVAQDFDVRGNARARGGATSRDANAAIDRLRTEAGQDVEARVDRRGALRSIAARSRPLTRPDASDPTSIALRFIARHHAAFGLEADDVASLVVSRRASSRTDGLVHVDFQQEARGLRVFGTGMRVHLTGAGEVVRVSSTAVTTGIENAPPSIDATEAVAIAVSQVRSDLAWTPTVLRGPRGPARETVFDRGPLASDVVTALELFPFGDELRLAWHAVVEPQGLPQKYDVLVDARTGELLYRRNRVLYAEGSGKVLQSDGARTRDPRLPDESPLGSGPGGALDGLAGCPPVTNHVSRSLAAPFRDSAGVLFDTGRLEGNNTRVFRGAAGIDGAAGTSQSGAWTFDFEFGTAASAETHLFFVGNFLHDFFYDLGFDEASGNFQVDNLGRGGIGGDSLSLVARADGRNNATFEPTPDGQSPILSMFLWDGSGCWATDMDGDGAVDLDGAFDSDIVIHEFHHGVSTRLNPFWSGDEADAMGEGGSDFFAYSINGDTTLAELSYPPTGIRMVNGRTYGSWDCLLGFFCEPHDNGEIWANLLWDLRERYRGDAVGGSDAAAVHAAHLLYIDGLKLSPPSPTMLDLRDAMLQADRLRHPGGDPGGSLNACRIWEVFALRGMGVGALDTSDTGTNTVVENFAMPTECPALPSPSTVTITAADAAASEAGADAGAFTVTRTGDTSRSLTVYLGAPTGSAEEGVDYHVLPAMVTIAAGDTSASVRLVPIDDSVVETNETVSLQLLTGPGYRVGMPASATITIVSEDVAPDLVVSTLTGPSVGGAGSALTVSETTRNQGNGSGGASTTRYYLSSNTFLDGGDTMLGSREIPPLSVGASSSANVVLTLPADTPTGTYYLLAQADAADAVGESNESNNLRFLFVRVGPDLLVSSLTVPTVAAAGASMSVTDSTRNQGGANAPGSATAFFLSADSLLDASDVFLASRAVPTLVAGQTQTATTTVTIPAGTATGSWYLIARADHADAVPETFETNNVAYGQFRVGPDLVVSTMSGPSLAGAGTSLTIADTTRNQGGAPSGASLTRFYLSTDMTVGAGDVPLGSRTVGALAAGASSAGSTALTIPSDTATGAYYVLAQADADGTNTETNEANNEYRIYVRIGPDLVVSSVVVPAVTAPGATIAVTNAIKNQGGGAAGASSARIYLSTNTTLDTADVLIGSRAVPALAAGASSSVVSNVTIPTDVPAAGLYYVVVQADAGSEVSETAETNNTAFAQTRIGPDFVVSAASATPTLTGAGATVTVADTTANTGGGAGPATTTAVYLSSNSILDAADVLVGSRSVPGLAAAASHAGTVVITVPAGTPSGLWQLILVADAAGVAAETTETNNTRTTSIFVGPDLKVASGTSPGKVASGASFAVTDTTTNAGGATAGTSTTRYYLSTNAVLDAADVPLGGRDVAALAPGARSAATVSLTIPAGTAPAQYYLLMVADANGSVSELYENNNTIAFFLAVN